MSDKSRHSEVAYVLVCLHIEGVPHFLLRRHEKWNDWSLVGGHLESSEMGSWAAAAVRETQEELPPLQHRRDFVLTPIFARPLAWGPIASRSASDRPTTYEAQFFAMELLQNPAEIFSRMAVEDLRLVPQKVLESGRSISSPLATLRARLGGGLTSVPSAWSRSVQRADLPQQLFQPLPS